MSEDKRPRDDSKGTNGHAGPDVGRDGTQEQANSVPGKRLGGMLRYYHRLAA